jgi:hypothetical protein
VVELQMNIVSGSLSLSFPVQIFEPTRHDAEFLRNFIANDVIIEQEEDNGPHFATPTPVVTQTEELKQGEGEAKNVEERNENQVVEGNDNNDNKQEEPLPDQDKEYEYVNL